MASISLSSFAKINWFLRVAGKRDDGYHEICTVFQMISLADTLTFEEASELSLECSDPRIPTDSRNLVLKAGNALREYGDVRTGASIRLEKRIPSPGGLGGGSSNAATALLGLATLWDLDVDKSELLRLGSKIGADVPFFLSGGTVLGTGTGTDLRPLEDRDPYQLLIVTPDVQISTRNAYINLGLERLTKNESESILQICCEDAKRLYSGQFEIFNDFERSVFQEFPELRDVKLELKELGASEALLCGSGASIFGVFDNESDRQAAEKKFSRLDGYRVSPAETISRSAFFGLMKPCRKLLQDKF